MGFTWEGRDEAARTEKYLTKCGFQTMIVGYLCLEFIVLSSREVKGHDLMATVSLCPSQDGMGNLRITERGLKLEGPSEFLKPLYAKEIQSKPVSPARLSLFFTLPLQPVGGFDAVAMETELIHNAPE